MSGNGATIPRGPVASRPYPSDQGFLLHTFDGTLSVHGHLCSLVSREGINIPHK